MDRRVRRLLKRLRVDSGRTADVVTYLRCLYVFSKGYVRQYAALERSRTADAAGGALLNVQFELYPHIQDDLRKLRRPLAGLIYRLYGEGTPKRRKTAKGSRKPRR